MLKIPVVKLQLQLKLDEALAADLEQHSTPVTLDCEEDWADIRDTTYKMAAEVLGYKTRVHQDWFDKQDTKARGLLYTMHATHLVWINDKNITAKKAAYTKARQS